MLNFIQFFILRYYKSAKKTGTLINLTDKVPGPQIPAAPIIDPVSSFDYTAGTNNLYRMQNAAPNVENNFNRTRLAVCPESL
jgi:hypothetical protein